MEAQPEEYILDTADLSLVDDIKSALSSVYKYSESVSTKQITVDGVWEANDSFATRASGSFRYGSVPSFGTMVAACIEYEKRVRRIINIRSVWKDLPIGIFLKSQKLKYNANNKCITPCDLKQLVQIKSWKAWIDNKRLFAKMPFVFGAIVAATTTETSPATTTD